ncbi:hypothetical protein CC80DRAFT_472022 [Byssothecium circinans]|uniref:Uncharacterized protein n=1 Tax=Byssothecium circinans TaxID=147558 RepID=A0A6A5TV53_9PLEO|nr:hypothetical protein CC80DRAFT_472022 [Byssothecium circinans]
MSKPRKTPIPLPGTQSKIAAPPPKGALSQEFINSSDDSSAEVEAQPKTTPKKAPVQIAVHRPKNNGVAKDTQKVAKKQKEVVKSAPKAKPQPKKPEPKRVAVAEDGAGSTSSEGNSDEESEEEAETDIKKAQQREKDKAASKSDSDSDSESEESEDEPAPAVTSGAATSQPNPTPTKTHNVEFVAARPYVPPKGFHPASTNQAQSSSSTALFDNLEGKQVWHITAPTDVSLKQLKELAMEQALKGDTVLQHKDTNYGFLNVEDNDDNDSRQVVIPRQNGYKAVSARISHTFHLREVVNLPNLSSLQADPNTGSEAAASITQSTIRAPRPQVKGLKMRYFPSGVADHTPVNLGSSDDENDAPPVRTAGLAVPNSIHLPVGKRKHEDANGDERVESPTKKHRKHRTPEEIKRREERRARKEKKREKTKS